MNSKVASNFYIVHRFLGCFIRQFRPVCGVAPRSRKNKYQGQERDAATQVQARLRRPVYMS
jgi:hypothetical protein